MRILHIITGLQVGGAETTLYNLLKEWKQRHGDDDHHAVIYFRDGPYVKKIRDLGVPIFQVKGLISTYDPVALYRLAKLVHKLKSDCIHALLWSATITSRFVAWLYNIPLVCALHGNCEHYGTLRNVIDRLTISVPDRFIAVSRSVEGSFQKKFGKSKNVRKNTRVIQNGINSGTFCKKAQEKPLSRQDLGLLDDDVVIGSVGRLHKIKRYDLLLEAFARMAQGNERARLCLVGDGEERAALEALAEKLGIADRVVFVGMTDEVYRYYPLFDCFVLSSESEGLSIALLEALCFGLPIVTTCDRNIHDVVTDGTNGFLVPPNNIEKLSDALQKLYSNANIVALMREKNILLVQNVFHIEAVVHRYRTLFHDVISVKRRQGGSI